MRAGRVRNQFAGRKAGCPTKAPRTGALAGTFNIEAKEGLQPPGTGLGFFPNGAKATAVLEKSFEQPSGFTLNVGAPTFFTPAVAAAAMLD